MTMLIKYSILMMVKYLISPWEDYTSIKVPNFDKVSPTEANKAALLSFVIKIGDSREI